jgi:hypothetical protein
MGEFSDYDDDDGDFANYDMDAAIAASSSQRCNASLTKENVTNSDDPSPPAKKIRPTATTTASTHDSANVSVASNQGYANDANIVDNDTPIIDDDNNNNYDDEDNVQLNSRHN